MFDLIKLVAMVTLIATVWLAIPIGSVILGSALALWVLYFLLKEINAEIEDESDDSSDY
jgi:hypothetical protein